MGAKLRQREYGNWGDMEVNVWVNNREKKVKGLTKRTTCHDVITALLYNKTKADKLADDYIESYVIIEQWRECERVLPRNTKIIKIWRAWHNEQTNVKFILRKKTTESITNDNKQTKPKEIPPRISRKRRPGEKSCGRRAHSVERSDQQDNVKWLNEQNNHRISRSNDELLDSQSYRSISLADVVAPASDKLMELVIGQEEQIQNLMETIRQTDLEIEYYETQMHVCRMYANGKDYVQESYLSANGDNDVLVSNDKYHAVSGGCETQSRESIELQKKTFINQCVLDMPVTDKDCNEVTQGRILSSEKECADSDKLVTISNVTYEPSIRKSKKHVTFAKLDSEGNRICADSIESLNEIGIDRKTTQIMPTCYETNELENRHSPVELKRNITTQPDETLNRLNCVKPNNNIKGILHVNNKHTMATHQLTESTIWDQASNDTDSSSDTGLSSMQDSEDGGAVHFASVTLV
ncbi:ras association domain-containing protein 10-like isoform X2 [Anneissia japonica]|uniref:ras association domain-containing protein 10-like isoform X2 n=1 Tax=Anneissia japonica TaxID=1529436 RepID=UPI00142598A1|nr:ras association domain-containing protein 10-like isoform X2 [Anneissia japonica]